MMHGQTTDQAWIQWGEQDPYYAVITDPQFRSDRITEEAKRQFFDSGRRHLEYVVDCCTRYLGTAPAPKRALDFGCGVGRVALPMAERFESVVGVDISPAMLAEARRNGDALGLRNIELVQSDPELSAVSGSFDFVHSAIVFQHIDVQRGRRLFQRLLELLAPGGSAAIQVTYAKAYHPDTYGQPPTRASAPEAAAPKRGLFSFAGGAEAAASLRQSVRSVLAVRRPGADPEMQMNPYSLGELAFLMQHAGVRHFHTEFTDHGGELGVFLFFDKPAV